MTDVTHPTIDPFDFDPSQATVGSAQRPAKSVLTYSALNTFRNCPRKFKHRYVDQLQPREKAESLSFGDLIHTVLELWYRSTGNANRLWTALDYTDTACISSPTATSSTRPSKYCILLGDRWGLRNAVKKNNTIRCRTFLIRWASEEVQP